MAVRVLSRCLRVVCTYRHVQGLTKSCPGKSCPDRDKAIDMIGGAIAEGKLSGCLRGREAPFARTRCSTSTSTSDAGRCQEGP